MVPPFMFIIVCLLFLCFLEFAFISQVLQMYYIAPDVSYGSWNSLSITSFANKHDNTINNECLREVIVVLATQSSA